MRRRRQIAAALIAGLVAWGSTRSAHMSGADALTTLEPTLNLRESERQQLAARKVVLKILPASGHELALVVAGSLRVGADQLIARINDISALERSPHIPQVGRFSTVPTLEDLSGLTLDEVDLDALKKCAPHDCALKLTIAEILQLRQATANLRGDAWIARATEQFRQLVLDHVRAYLTGGLAGVPTDEGDPREGRPAVFAKLVHGSPLIRAQAPQLAGFLERFPAESASDAIVGSFLYWSKEKYAWKPMISVTHVTISRPSLPSDAEVVVLSREVFATRYTSGALSLTMLLRGPDASAPHYLIYESQSWVDSLRFLWRPFVEHHVKSEATSIFNALRTRIEDGPHAAAAR